MHQQRSRDSKRSLLLLVQQYRPSTGTFDPDHPWQWESVQELAQWHETTTGTRGLGGRLSWARQRVLASSGGLAARQCRKFTTRRHRDTVSLTVLRTKLVPLTFHLRDTIFVSRAEKIFLFYKCQKSDELLSVRILKMRHRLTQQQVVA